MSPVVIRTTKPVVKTTGQEQETSVVVRESEGSVVVRDPDTRVIVNEPAETKVIVRGIRPGPEGPEGPEGPQGDIGPQGEPGLHGDSGTSFYTHDQSIPSDIWVIIHNLGFYPNITVENSAGDECEGEVIYDSVNQITLTFSAGFAGKAYLS